MSANAPAFVFADAAADELEAIIAYSAQHWGETQARRYAAALIDGCRALASDGPRIRPCDDLYPGLKMLRCEHHYIFGLVLDAQPTRILAIFHERMDLMTRVKRRLSEGEAA